MSVSNTQRPPHHPAPTSPRAPRFGPRRCAGWLLLYALIVVFSSLVLGPLGYHFVPRDPAAAWQAFLATPFFNTGSDQRPDWIANLLMMVPFGLLAAGTFGAARGLAMRVLGTMFALLLSLGFVLAVKYAQLFFPPRTVSLNYIIAQSIGAALGVGLFPPLHAARSRLAGIDEASRLRLVLDVAILGFIAFALFPFDLTLSARDLAHRVMGLPRVLLSLPDATRPLGVQIIMFIATAVTAVPLGMRLCLPSARGQSPSLARVVATGAALLAILFGASLFILSARASFATYGLRLLGVVAGAMLLRWLAARDLRRLRYWAGRGLPVMLPLYLLLLVYANGLLTRAWVAPEQALAGLDLRGLVPLWHDYIVSKAHALQSDVVHVAMYAPVGVMIWLRRGGTQGTALAAGVMAGLLSLAIELGRGLKPGLQPDLNEVLIGAIAAYAANRVMPIFWPVLLSVSAPMPSGVPSAKRSTTMTSAERAGSVTSTQHAVNATSAQRDASWTSTERAANPTSTANAATATSAEHDARPTSTDRAANATSAEHYPSTTPAGRDTRPVWW